MDEMQKESRVLRLYQVYVCACVDYRLKSAGGYFRKRGRDEMSGVSNKLFIIRGYTKLA
jgi:hypothetical protein